MPNLSKVVSLINDKLKINSLNRMAFQDGKYYGLAQSVAKYDTDRKEAEPVIYTGGQEVRCFIDDTFPFQIYHRVTSLPISKPKDLNFGDGNTGILETANMIAVVYGDPEILKIDQYDLSYLIVAGIPSEISKTDLGNSKIQNITIVPQSVNLNSVSVYQGEYQLAEYPLKPQSIYFAVNYQIEISSDKKCLSCQDC